MLDLRRLRVLHAVKTHGSVTAAAVALGYSGSAVSQQLAALEREIGMPLTERAGRTITLTPAADILVAHADVLFTQLEAAESEVAHLRDRISGKVTLGAFPSAASTIVPPAWAALATAEPHVQLDIREMEPVESLRALAQGDIDVAIAHEYDAVPRPSGPRYERRRLFIEPVLIAMHADLVAEMRADLMTDSSNPIPLGLLAGTPFLTPQRSTSCAEMTHRACAAAGFTPSVVAHATDFNVLLSLVAVGAGVALIPRLAVRHLPPQVCLIAPIEPISRTVFTICRSGGHRRPAVGVVVEALSRAARTLGPDGMATFPDADQSC